MDSLEERLTSAVSQVPDTRALALVGRDGLLVASAGPEAGADELPRVAAEATDLLTAAERTLDEGPEEAVGRAVAVRGSRGSLYLHVLEDALFLLWWLGAGTETDGAARVSFEVAGQIEEAVP